MYAQRIHMSTELMNAQVEEGRSYAMKLRNLQAW